MRLPKEFLETISYYEYTSKYGMSGCASVFVFHFKKWYKFRKKIIIRWDRRPCSDVYTECPESVELRQQLKIYFND